MEDSGHGEGLNGFASMSLGVLGAGWDVLGVQIRRGHTDRSTIQANWFLNRVETLMVSYESFFESLETCCGQKTQVLIQVNTSPC
jgi:hypothetical protein